jgi:hypothetical protein
MKTHFRMLTKFLALTLFAIGVFSFSSGVARADEVTITGFSAGAITGVPQLSFTGNSSFTGTTSLGIGSLSGSNSLGTFFLNTDTTQLAAGTFFLNIFFTSPAGIAGGPSITTTGIIKGSISPNIDQGGINIGFGSSLFFPFDDGIHNGYFTLVMPPMFVQSGQAASLTAGFSGRQDSIPEPATLLLLGSGLTAIAAKMRRRRLRK